MSKNIRYLKTKVKNDNVYIIMYRCNYCPFLKVDKENKNAICGNPMKNNAKSDIVKENINYHENENRNIVFESCHIPDFCYLSKNLKEEFDKSELIIKKNNQIFSFSSPRLDDEKILSEIYLTFKETGELKYNKEYKKFLKSKKEFDERDDRKNTYLPVQIRNIVNGNICSYCGEIKEDVKRTTNNGMCCECVEKSKNDNNILYNSVLNNFRLKRNNKLPLIKYNKNEKYFVF